MCKTKIKPPQNYYTKVDLELVKKKIEKKVKTYCQILQMNDDLVPICLAFANEICAELVSASPTLKYKPVIDKYTISGIKVGYLHRIMNIANKTYHTEEKKIAKKKPLRLEKAKEMAVKYLRSRVKIEPIQAKVSKLLGEHNLADTVWYNSYMNFARECFGKIRKYYIKDPLLLKQQLAEIMKSWQAQGLKEEVLLTIKDIITVHFAPIKIKE